MGLANPGGLDYHQGIDGVERESMASGKVGPLPADRSASLAAALMAQGDSVGAEAVFRRALALQPEHEAAASGLAELLMRLGRPDAAVEATAVAAGSSQVSHALLALHARTLQAAGRREAALKVYLQAAQRHPRSGAAEHNVAGVLGDLGRFAEAEAAALRARAKGLDAPETWLVLGRALMNQNKFHAAEAALGEALVRRPRYADAHRDLAQLIWMQTGELQAATATLDRALAGSPVSNDLLALKADLLSNAGHLQAAYDLLKGPARLAPEAIELDLSAARLAAQLDQPEAALSHAQAAARHAPRHLGVEAALCEAHLALGHARTAEAMAARLLQAKPADQALISYLATAWRLLGDERYHAWMDYGRLTAAEEIDTPPGWARLGDFLDDLEAALVVRHAFKTHPLGQSVRHGSQISHLNASDDPVIKAFFQAIAGPIRRYIARTAGGTDPMSSRNAGGYHVDGAWSVRLAAGGHHKSHIHPDGWISSACYIALPERAGAERAGWLQFGEPGSPTRPELPPDHAIEPRRGLLALFPAYMWHGTRPFIGERVRMTMAFDLTPAARA